jgi:uncharacterized delta-60 repeat protein
VVCSAFGLALAACSGGGGGGAVVPIDVPPANLDALIPLRPARASLPGRVELLLEARGGLDHVGDLLPDDFAVQEGTALLSPVLLDNDQIDLRLLPLEPVLRDSYMLVVDGSQETLANSSKRAVQAQWATWSLETILERPAAEVSLARMGPEGLETWPDSKLATWSSDSGELALALAQMLAAPALGSGIEIGPSVDSAQANLVARMASLEFQVPARAGRGTMVLIAGQESSGALPQPGIFFPPPPEPTPRRLGLALGSFDLLNNVGAISAGVEFWGGNLPAQEEADFEAYLERRLDSAYRVAYLTPARDGDGTISGTLSSPAEGADPAIAYEFSSDAMGPGAGHIDPWPAVTAEAGGILEQAHRAVAVDGLGRLWVASDLNTIGFSVRRYLPDGSPDLAFGSGGRLLFVPQAPYIQWRGLDLIAEGSSGQALVLTQRSGSGSVSLSDTRGVVLRIDAQGVLAQRELPGATAVDQGDYVSAMRVDASGRIWVAGSSSGSAFFPQRRALWRLNPDLSVDISLDGDGAVSHKVSPGQTFTETATALALIPGVGQTRAILAGSAFSLQPGFGAKDGTFVAFNEGGDVAFDFGSNGVVQVRGLFHQTSVSFLVSSLDVDPQGRLVASGAVSSTSLIPQVSPAVLRFNSAGQPDGTFGLGADNRFGPGTIGSGVGIWAPVATLDQTLGEPVPGGSFTSAALRPDGSTTLLGYRSNTLDNLDLLWMRLTPAGVLDTTFNGLGYLIEDSGLLSSGSELPTRLLRREDGALVTVGAVNALLLSSNLLVPLVMIDTDPLRAN